MTTRRSFISKSALVSLSVMTLPYLGMGAEKTQLRKFGFISGIIGKELKGEWKAILKKTVEYGFTEIEIGQYLGDSAFEFLSFCKEIGLRPIAGGIPFTKDDDELQKKLDAICDLNMNYAVTYWPWFTGGPFMLDDCEKSVETLNYLGEACKKRGLTFCWHNHNKEFIEMEEGLPFDYLMEHTDNKLVKCELDVFWVQKGGANPLEVLKKYEGRIEILHLKDMTNDAEQTYECVGSGKIDFPSILKEANKQNIKHFFVEFDNVTDGMACLRSSGKYLEDLRF